MEAWAGAFTTACAGAFVDAFVEAWAGAFTAACAGAFVDALADAFPDALADSWAEAFVDAFAAAFADSWAEAFVDAFVDSSGDAAPVAKHRIAPKRPAATPRRKSCAPARSRHVPMHANARQRDWFRCARARTVRSSGFPPRTPALQVNPVSGCRWFRVLINPAPWRGSMLVLPRKRPHCCGVANTTRYATSSRYFLMQRHRLRSNFWSGPGQTTAQGLACVRVDSSQEQFCVLSLAGGWQTHTRRHETLRVGKIWRE